MDDKDEKKKPAEKLISLKPLKFEEAVEGLLRTPPPSDKKLNSGRRSAGEINGKEKSQDKN